MAAPRNGDSKKGTSQRTALRFLKRASNLRVCCPPDKASRTRSAELHWLPLVRFLVSHIREYVFKPFAQFLDAPGPERGFCLLEGLDGVLEYRLELAQSRALDHPADVDP